MDDANILDFWPQKLVTTCELIFMQNYKIPETFLENFGKFYLRKKHLKRLFGKTTSW